MLNNREAPVLTLCGARNTNTTARFGTVVGTENSGGGRVALRLPRLVAGDAPRIIGQVFNDLDRQRHARRDWPCQGQRRLHIGDSRDLWMPELRSLPKATCLSGVIALKPLLHRLWPPSSLFEGLLSTISVRVPPATAGNGQRASRTNSVALWAPRRSAERRRGGSQQVPLAVRVRSSVSGTHGG